jgi:hypothetical protein
MVCESEYHFGDGSKKAMVNGRISTAIGGRGDPGRLDYGSNQGNISLPNIGLNAGGNRPGLSTSNGGRYQTLNQSNTFLNTNKGPIIRQAEALDENRIVLYKKSKQLGQGYYIVEISSNNTHLFIAAYDLESTESLLIELPERRA